VRFSRNRLAHRTALSVCRLHRPVVAVPDDDTIEILHNQRPERILLREIDCPEKGQAFANRAKQAASELVIRRDVTFQKFSKDKYGRTMGEVILHDGTNVIHALAKDGWCWWCRKYVQNLKL